MNIDMFYFGSDSVYLLCIYHVSALQSIFCILI